MADDKKIYGLVKGVVTRNLVYLPKPYIESKIDDRGTFANTNNPYEIQVWIPSMFSGDKSNPYKPDKYRIGTADNYGSYPWCQMCSPLFKDQIGIENQEFPDIWSSMFFGHYLEKLPSTYPAIGDIVFIAFENGNPKSPIYVGTLLADKNSVDYYKDNLSGDIEYRNLTSRMVGREVVEDDTTE